MTSTLPANRVWEEAETLIIRLDRAARTSHSFAAIYQQIVSDVLQWSHASSVGIWTQSPAGCECLASAGPSEFCSAAAGEANSVDRSFLAKAYWKLPDISADGGLRAGHVIHAATQAVDSEWFIQLVIVWSNEIEPQAPDAARRSMISEVSLVVIELCAMTFMRERWEVFQKQTLVQAERIDSLVSLYRGTSVPEAFHQIAKTLAVHRNADRISILQIEQRRSELIATSANHIVDRRSQLALSLKALAESTQDCHSPLRFSVGQLKTEAAWRTAVDRYVIESGCRHLEIDRVPCASDPKADLAVIITEWFGASEFACDSTFREHAHDAIQQAVANQTLAWASLYRQFARKLRSKAFLLTCSLASMGALLLTLVPVTFTLPVEGQVRPAQYRRIFSPADAVVSSILIKNGQAVEKGSDLFVLRSSVLDLREEQLRGELLTTKTRLASLPASRSTGSSNDASSLTQSLSISATEQALKTEVVGLEKQLAVVESQKQALKIKSPLPGIADRWDLVQSLDNRPVTQGQHLIDVYSPLGDWNLELELPDQYASHLSSDSGSQKVRFRLKSQPDRDFHAVISETAKSTQLNPQGQSFVRVKCQFDPDPVQSLAIGSTVWADIDCGKRALGFVWFRGLFEWFERQAWY